MSKLKIAISDNENVVSSGIYDNKTIYLVLNKNEKEVPEKLVKWLKQMLDE